MQTVTVSRPWQAFLTTECEMAPALARILLPLFSPSCRAKVPHRQKMCSVLEPNKIPQRELRGQTLTELLPGRD